MIYKYARVPITDRSLTAQQKGGWGGGLRRAGVWGQKRLGGRRTLSTGAWRAAKRKSEQADDWGWGGVVLGECLGKTGFEEEEAKSLGERKSRKTALGG